MQKLDDWHSILDAQDVQMNSPLQVYKWITLRLLLGHLDLLLGMITSLTCSVKKIISKFSAWLATL